MFFFFHMPFATHLQRESSVYFFSQWWNFWIFCYHSLWTLYVSWILTLIFNTDVYSHSVKCLLVSVCVSFLMQKIVWLSLIYLFYFFWLLTFRSKPWTSLPILFSLFYFLWVLLWSQGLWTNFEPTELTYIKIWGVEPNSLLFMWIFIFP